MADSIYAVLPTASLQEAILALDKSRRGCVLVCNPDGTFLDILTDGDLRRAFLSQVPLTTRVFELPKSSKPLTLPSTTRDKDIRAIMEKDGIRHVPILNQAGKVYAVAVLYGDLDFIPAVVMVGGKGERLMPLTAETPKSLLPIGDKTILDHILDGMAEAGIAEVCLATGYLAEQFRDTLHYQMHIDIIQENEPKGTAGALYGLRDNLAWPLLVVNGDLLTDIDYRAMVQYHKEHKATLTMAVRKITAQVPYGVIETDSKGFVHYLSEKPSWYWFINAGIYLLEQDALSWLPDGRYDMTDLIRVLLDKTESNWVSLPVAAFPIWEAWQDVGTPEVYREVNQ